MLTFSSYLQSISSNCNTFLCAIKMSSNYKILRPLFLQCFHSSKTPIFIIWRVQIIYPCKIPRMPLQPQRPVLEEWGFKLPGIPWRIIRNDANQNPYHILNGHEATSLQPAQCRLGFMNHSLQDTGHGFQTTAPQPGQWSNKEQEM